MGVIHLCVTKKHRIAGKIYENLMFVRIFFSNVMSGTCGENKRKHFFHAKNLVQHMLNN